MNYFFKYTAAIIDGIETMRNASNATAMRAAIASLDFQRL